MKNLKKVIAYRITIARLFFIISALYGLLLRLYYIVDFIPVAYKNVLQAHSHVTFLGWGFLAVITLIDFSFIFKRKILDAYSKWLFSIMTFTLFGMLISFPIQGYKVFSIVFLTVFLITSYLYLFRILKELKQHKSTSAKYIRTGIGYYYLSSIAIWVVAIVTVKLGKTDLYFNAVYFYLHFLYNGFFVLTLFGLLLKYFENNNIQISKKHIFNFYWLTNIALIPAYALSVLWLDEVPSILYYIGFFAGILQLISLFYFWSISNAFLKNTYSKHVKIIALFVFISYSLKIVLQFLSAFPSLIEITLQFKPYFLIGYLHLFTLGFMSLFIILIIKKTVKFSLSRIGVNFLMLGVFLSEVLLFAQGILLLFFSIAIPKINYFLFYVSALMPLGLLIIHFTSFIATKTKKPLD